MPSMDFFPWAITTTNAATTLYSYPIQSLTVAPPFNYTPPAPLHVVDTPEAWLRRRVREVCELAA